MQSLAGVPGADLVQQGMKELAAGVDSIPALLVAIGAPRLQQLGFDIPRTVAAPEHLLYRVLAASDPDTAHSRYNALVRRLVSFERAFACGR